MDLPKKLQLQLNHDLTAKEFVYKAVCVNCVIREGWCTCFCDGDLDECNNKCWHYAKAVRAVKKILDKYDK